jgi:solute:Na+ symporter, SSS family
MPGIHVIDLFVVLLYLLAIIYIGRRAKSSAKSEEGYFLAGRKLGKLYQIFLNFGNATEPQGAVTTASFVYQRGASGAWYSFQTVFMNPYYWFMNVWFRRVRLTTMGDLFEDRFGSRNLARFYALFQISVAVLLIGFGTFTAYTITASLVTKPDTQWTAEERASVEGYNELAKLEQQVKTGALESASQARLETLRDQRARGELRREISVLAPAWAKWTFYISFMAVVAAYMALGGMTAAAFNEALQGSLIVVFSIMLIPTGIHYLGGWDQLSLKVPANMFDLFGASGTVQFNTWSIVAITLPSLIQMNALSPNMNIYGSAKNEYAARMGVIGLYAKRLMIILWTFAGLIAIAIFSGDQKLTVPDTVWGMLSQRLLGPGLIGLMLAGVIAAVMSNLAAKSMAIASLFVKNFCRHIRPNLSEATGVLIARWTIVVVLAIGLLAATTMSNMERIVGWVITVNVPFGAAILLMFFWRRLTVQAVWIALALCVVVNILIPLTGEYIPAIGRNPALTITTVDTEGRPAPVYFDAVVRSIPNDLSSPLRGTGRFNMEAFLVGKLGFDVTKFTPNQLLNTRYFWDGLFPFVVLILASLFTRDSNRERADLFFGKMKTPVGDTPELDAAAMEETRRNPRRFDNTKLFGPQSSWEFGKWDREDAVGFIACLAVSVAIILLFVGLLNWASPA